MEMLYGFLISSGGLSTWT